VDSVAITTVVTGDWWVWYWGVGYLLDQFGRIELKLESVGQLECILKRLPCTSLVGIVDIITMSMTFVIFF
jgi:hypothetical protein